MKKLLLLIAVCAIIATAPSCSNKNSSAPTTGIPEWADVLMQTVPDNTPFVAFLDIETLRSDPDLRLYYTDRQQWFYNSSSSFGNLFDFNQMDYWVSGTYGDLITGNFDIEAAESILIDNSWLQDTYENFSLFEKETCWEQKENIAFGKGLIIGGLNSLGNSIIQTINGEQQSIFENTQFKDLMMQLPANGFEISYADNDYTTSDSTSIRLLAGNAISKLDNSSLRYTYILTAPGDTISDAIIEDLINDIKNYNEAFAQADMESTRKGSYITITSDIPISSFSNSSSISQ
jgi:hypothetical protein